jgi:hypothetical protein
MDQSYNGTGSAVLPGFSIDGVGYVDGFGVTLPGSGLTYAADHQYATHWGWSQMGAPANYYDNVAAYYALYYRSGIDDYLTAARKLADRFWESPPIDQGVMQGGYLGQVYIYSECSLCKLGWSAT